MITDIQLNHSTIQSSSFDDSTSYRDHFAQNTHDKIENDCDIAISQSLVQNEYHFIRRLGKGTQGSVFLAQKGDRKVAIKQLNIASVKDWKQYDLFHREADTLRRLDIPGIAKLIEVREFLDIPEPRAFIVQEYIEGSPLQEFIAQGHRFQIGQIGDLLLQLLNIIEKLHKSDPPVIHRDIKPSNILLNYANGSLTPEVHLIDFGAVANPQVKSGGSTVVGTYGYMAPEQLMGHACPASDIYSLAIVAVYLLSGVAPENLEIQDFQVIIDPHLEHLPHQITSFLRQMLAPKVEDRITDFDTIRKYFCALKEQKFENIPYTKTAMKPARALSFSRVKSYQQAGNIELWQSLDDKTPRKLPFNLKMLILKDSISDKKHRESKVGRLAGTPSSTIMNAIIDLVVFLGVLIVFTGYVIFDELIKSQELFFYSITVDIVVMILFVFILFILILIIYNALDNYIKNNNHQYKRFFEHARKSMATVIRINYNSVYRDLKYVNNPNSHHAFYPTWEITYSFNPPDDSSPDPIVRTFKTHTLPDALHEGSLIPILYLIQNDEEGEHVLSTPFPVPACDNLEISDK